jgi:hypothetical protein
MGPVAQGDIIVSNGDHEIDVAEHEARLVRHIIRFDPEVSPNVYSVAQDKSMDDVSQHLGQCRQGDRFMSDIDPEVVRLVRNLLIHTDKLGAGHQTRAKDIAHQLDLAGKVIIDKGSVPEWMEQAPDALTSELMYRFKTES